MPATGPEWMVCSASVEFSCAMPPELWMTSIGCVIAVVAQVLLQLRQRVVHGRVQEGVDDGRRRAHVLALAPGQLMDEQHRDRAELVRRVLGSRKISWTRQFVSGFSHRVGQAHHQRLGARVDQLAQRQPDVVLVERQQDRAGVVDPLATDRISRLRDERVRAGPAGHVVLGQLVQPLAVAAAAGQRDRRLEPGGDDRADLRALAARSARSCPAWSRSAPSPPRAGRCRAADPGSLQAWSSASLKPWARLWCVVSAFAWM